MQQNNDSNMQNKWIALVSLITVCMITAKGLAACLFCWVGNKEQINVKTE